MAHEIDTHEDKAAFVTARKDAWHQLGTTLDHSFTAEEALQEGHLGGWDVRTSPLITRLPDGTEVEIPNKMAVLRNNPFTPGQVDALGTVGSTYSIVQNEQHIDFLNALVDESGAHFETAGALYGGKVVFVTMKLPVHIAVGGVDGVDTYIAAMNSHDGSMAFTTMVTPVRIVCANTMNIAMGHNTGVHRVRHTSGAHQGIVAKARQTLDLTFSYLNDFQEEAERLINTTMTQSRFEEIVRKEFGAEKDAPAQTITRCDNKIDQMVQLFADANTHEEVRGTAWAGLNALTEWYDHFSPTRGGERDTARAQKALLDPEFKNQARRLILAS